MSLPELRERGIANPAAVIYELELAGYEIDRVHRHGRLLGVRLGSARSRVDRARTAPPLRALTGGDAPTFWSARLNELVHLSNTEGLGCPAHGRRCARACPPVRTRQAPVKPITDIDDPRYVKALAHPLRIRILAMLADRSASPVQLSSKLDATLGTVAYHVRTLHSLGLVELVDTRQRRGATEHYYRAREHPRFPDDAWSGLAPVAKQRMLSAMLQQIGQYVTALGRRGRLRPLRGAHDAQRRCSSTSAAGSSSPTATRKWLRRGRGDRRRGRRAPGRARRDGGDGTARPASRRRARRDAVRGPPGRRRARAAGNAHATGACRGAAPPPCATDALDAPSGPPPDP